MMAEPKKRGNIYLWKINKNKKQKQKTKTKQKLN